MTRKMGYVYSIKYDNRDRNRLSRLEPSLCQLSASSNISSPWLTSRISVVRRTLATSRNPPSASNCKRWRIELGVVLIERRTSGAELTPIGREITARARRLVIEVQDIRDLARRAGENLAGTIRFGVTPTLGPYLMPPIIAALHREQPDLRLHIREGIPEEQALALSRGALDMLLGPLPIEGSNLEVEPLFRERLFLVAPSDHPLAMRSNLEIGRSKRRAGSQYLQEPPPPSSGGCNLRRTRHGPPARL